MRTPKVLLCCYVYLEHFTVLFIDTHREWKGNTKQTSRTEEVEDVYKLLWQRTTTGCWWGNRIQSLYASLHITISLHQIWIHIRLQMHSYEIDSYKMSLELITNLSGLKEHCIIICQMYITVFVLISSKQPLWSNYLRETFNLSTSNTNEGFERVDRLVQG